MQKYPLQQLDSSARGNTPNDVDLSTAYLKVVNILWYHERGFPFHKQPPVDIYPQYYKIIDKPIALVDIKKKIKTGMYSSPSQFKDDIELMYRNCQQFNTDDSYIFQSSKILEQLAFKEMEKEGLLKEKVKQEIEETKQPLKQLDQDIVKKQRNQKENEMEEYNKTLERIIEDTRKHQRQQRFTRSLPRKVFEKLANYLQQCNRKKLIKVIEWFYKKRPNLLEVEGKDIIHIRADGMQRADAKALQRVFKFQIL